VMSEPYAGASIGLRQPPEDTLGVGWLDGGGWTAGLYDDTC